MQGATAVCVGLCECEHASIGVTGRAQVKLQMHMNHGYARTCACPIRQHAWEPYRLQLCLSQRRGLQGSSRGLALLPLLMPLVCPTHCGNTFRPRFSLTCSVISSTFMGGYLAKGAWPWAHSSIVIPKDQMSAAGPYLATTRIRIPVGRGTVRIMMLAEQHLHPQSSIPPHPHSHQQDLQDPNWCPSAPWHSQAHTFLSLH